MKKFIYIIAFISSINLINAQVGIGVETPASSAMLEVTSTDKGVLYPRVELTSTTSKSPLSGTIPDGTTVINTKKSGTGITAVIPAVYVWYNNEWRFPAEIGKTSNVAAKYTTTYNQNLTNLNPTLVSSPLTLAVFNTAVFNDDTTIFDKTSTSQFTIKQTGIYLVTINFALRQAPAIDQSRLTDYFYLNLNGSLASAKTITLVPQYNPARVNINGRFNLNSSTYVNVTTANSILTVHSQRYKDGTNYNGFLYFDNNSSSSITIVKVQ